MGHKYVKEEDTFSTSANGTVPKPTPTEVTAGKYLKANGSWAMPPGGGGGASELNDLTDVDISNLADGQILQYIADLGMFKNANAPKGLPSYFMTIPIAPDYAQQAQTIDFARLIDLYSSLQGLVFCRYGISYFQAWREGGSATIRHNGNLFGSLNMPSYSIVNTDTVRMTLPAYNTAVFFGYAFQNVTPLI